MITVAREVEQQKTAQTKSTSEQLHVTLFSNETAITQEQSLRALKRCFFAAISHILCTRGALNSECFVPVLFGEIRTLLVRNNQENKASQRVLELVAEMSNAISKRSVKRIILGFYDDENRRDNFYEWYEFSFKFDDGGRAILELATSASPNGSISVPFDSKSVESLLQLVLLHIQTATGLMGKLHNAYNFGFIMENVEESEFAPKLFTDLGPDEPLPPPLACANEREIALMTSGPSISVPLGKVEMPFSGFGITAYTRRVLPMHGLDSSQSQPYTLPLSATPSSVVDSSQKQNQY